MAERDLDISGDPGPDDDEAGTMPFAPNNENLPAEDSESDVEGLADEADELGSDLEETADEAEGDEEDSPEDPPKAGVPDSSPAPSTPPPSKTASNLPSIQTRGAATTSQGDIGPSDIPDSGDEEAPPPTEEEMGGIEDSLSDFGEKLEQFNAAGGVNGPDKASVPTGGEDNDPAGPLGQFADSVVNYATTANEFLTEHARLINDLQRRLELERL